MPSAPQRQAARVPPEIFTVRLTDKDASDFRRLFKLAEAEVPPGARQTRHSFARWLVRTGMNAIDKVRRRR